ncbi:hypothetical protein I79_001139 [Cricetulus griseus]|uniref:Uncharacterized protein n=1 Tax=Cricetulus griseus TaxID=10029 RepID=G3GTZ5_CRIGR|nr:hypothetical protein I79_001139 [Cricetulus griseus]
MGHQVIFLRPFHTLDPHKKQRSAANCWGCKLLSSRCGMKELVNLHVGGLGLSILTANITRYTASQDPLLFDTNVVLLLVIFLTV